ncbi:MAG: hypothetical protein OES13_02210 [Acidimicrobiia bacterium]|nr:hypothetical protein [Acidimicrobiia bacterium]
MIVEGFKLIFAPEEEAGAQVIRGAIEDSVPVIRQLWPFRPPRRAKVVVWTDWMDGYRQGLPRFQLLLLPLFRKRIVGYGDRLWKLVGGITLRSQPPAVLVKPPRVLADADIRIGEKLFVHLDDINDRVRSITCHELAHAYATVRPLPAWLNEGIAMLTVDRLFGFDTVKPQTMELLGAVTAPVRSYRALPRLTNSELVKFYARGYWLTRYLHEQHPEELRRILSQRFAIGVTDRRLAKIVGVQKSELWEKFDGIVWDHYRG